MAGRVTTHDLPELDDNFYIEGYEEDDDKDMEFDREEVDLDSMHWRFRETTWSQSHFTYDLPRRRFLGRRGPMRYYHSMPTFMYLFDLYWSYQTLRSIVRETNRYALEEVDGDGKPKEGKTLEITNCSYFESISCSFCIYENEKTTE
jgi:hypothetical protein